MSQPDNTPETNPPEKLIKLNRPDYDGAWKVSLDQYFKDFLALLFPAIHAEVDWSKGYVFLDSELAKITVDAKTGRRYADKLVKVHTLAGVEEWLLIHVEVQSSPEPQGVFARRMFTYWSRLMDYHQVDVVSLAVLEEPLTKPKEIKSCPTLQLLSDYLITKALKKPKSVLNKNDLKQPKNS